MIHAPHRPMLKRLFDERLKSGSQDGGGPG